MKQAELRKCSIVIREEDPKVSAPFREAYVRGVQNVVTSRMREADALRREYCTPEKLADNPQTYRSALVELLGWPLTESSRKVHQVVFGPQVPYGKGATMQRVQVEVLEGFPFYGILFLPVTAGPSPLVIVQHGGWGTPEQTADLHVPNSYKHITARLVAQGCAVFSPQMLLWLEGDDIPGHPGYNLLHHRQSWECVLRYLGGGITALEVYALMRSLDVLLEMVQIDAQRVGMVGVSYGGYYTQLTSALDERIRVAVSNAFFNDRYKYCWHDFAWHGAALRMKDPEICALIAPRALCIHLGNKDSVFSIESALPELQRLRAFYDVQGASDRLHILISNENHSLTDSGEEIDFLLAYMGINKKGMNE